MLCTDCKHLKLVKRIVTFQKVLYWKGFVAQYGNSFTVMACFSRCFCKLYVIFRRHTWIWTPFASRWNSCCFILNFCFSHPFEPWPQPVVTMTMNPDDLSDLEVLYENTIVQALRTRYNREKYYVSSYFISI